MRSRIARFAAASLIAAAPLSAQLPSDAASLAAAERAFARMAVDSGTHAAFVANLDSTGVVFQPRATNAQAWYASHRPKGPQGTLFWTPAHVLVSASGDLGFSTGPYRFEGIRGADTVRAGGFFASVWTRRPGGAWRVVVDLGIRDSVTLAVDSTRAPAVLRAADRKHGGKSEGGSLAEVLRADSALGRRYASADDGLLARAADDVRVLREGDGMRVGRDAAKAVAARAGDGYASVPADGAVARAGDFAYTYGTYVRDGTSAPAGNYLRAWRRDGGRWRLVLDVASPVPNG